MRQLAVGDGQALGVLHGRYAARIRALAAHSLDGTTAEDIVQDVFVAVWRHVFCPIGSLAIGAAMMTAIARIHWPKVWASDGGFELPLKNLAVVVAVGISGPGRFSLDRAFHSALPSNSAIFGAAVVTLGWCYALISSTLAVASGVVPVGFGAAEATPTAPRFETTREPRGDDGPVTERVRERHTAAAITAWRKL